MPSPMRMGNEGGTIKILCRTYGATDCRFYLYPALAGWAKLCRAYGARTARRLCHRTGSRRHAARAGSRSENGPRAGLNYVAPTALAQPEGCATGPGHVGTRPVQDRDQKTGRASLAPMTNGGGNNKVKRAQPRLAVPQGMA